MMAEKQVEILLVEDNPDDVELALHALKRHKLANTVHIARDGVEALELARRGELRLAQERPFDNVEISRDESVEAA